MWFESTQPKQRFFHRQLQLRLYSAIICTIAGILLIPKRRPFCPGLNVLIRPSPLAWVARGWTLSSGITGLPCINNATVFRRSTIVELETVESIKSINTNMHGFRTYRLMTTMCYLFYVDKIMNCDRRYERCKHIGGAQRCVYLIVNKGEIPSFLFFKSSWPGNNLDAIVINDD